jgi:DNA-binding XRE family transcriptional regulator
VRNGRIRDVDTDYGEITALKFPNVWTTPTTNRLGSVGVRIGTNTLNKSHGILLTIVRCFVKPVWQYFFRMPSLKSQQAVCSRVAQLLRQAREKQGLSMNLVAERAGLSQQMVSYVEREMRNPTLESLLRIAAALEIDLANVIREAQKTVSKSE